MSEFEIRKVYKQCKALPSGFGFYPKNTKVYFTPMTTKEVESLNESELSTKLIFENALAGIKTESVAKEDLTFSDFIFISMQRRVYSQTEVRCELRTTCSNCGKVITQDFDFNEFEFKEPNDNRLQCCTLGDYKVVIGPLTIGGMLDMLNSETGVTVVSTLAHCIRKIYGPDSDVQDIYTYELAEKIIENTWGEERDMLNYIDTLQEHGLEPREIICSNCGNTWKEDLGSLDTLIFPVSRIGHDFKDKVHPC